MQHSGSSSRPVGCFEARRLSRYGVPASVAVAYIRGMRDPRPQPGIEPTSPALQGGLLTAGPPGESLDRLLKAAEALCLGLVVEVGLLFSPGFQRGAGRRSE